MKTTSMKKFLLAGTAIVAVGSFAPVANAADITMAAGATWASAGGKTSADVANAKAGDNVDITTGAATLTVTNNGADDGSADTNTFDIGNVTDSGAGVGAVTVTTTNAADLTVTIDDVVIDGAFTVAGLDADDGTILVTIGDDLDIGGALSVTTTEADAADDATLVVTDDLVVDGTTTVKSGSFAGSTAVVTVGGDATFTGKVTLTSQNAAGANAILNVAGDTTFTGGLDLDDVTAGDGILNVNGTSNQTIAGAILGVSDGDGTVNVTNTKGTVTFTGTVGTAAKSLALVTVAAANGSNASATFQEGVDVTAITMGNAGGTDTNTITFDGSTTGFTVAGTLQGDGAANDTNNVRVIGGKTIVQSGIWGGGGNVIDALTVSGASTIFDSNAAITATTISVGSGATLDAAAVLTTTGGVDNDGTLLLSGAVSHDTNITGDGTLDVNGSATVKGSIEQDDITIAEAADFTVSAAAADRTVVGDILFEDAASDGTDATLALTLGNDIAFTGNITTQIDGEGEITLSAAAGDVTFDGDVGTAAKALGAITFAANAAATTISTADDLFVDAIAFAANDVITFTGLTGASQTVSGTINGNGGANIGTLTLGNGTTQAPTVTFSGIIGGTNDLAGLNVNVGSTAIFAAAGNNGFDGTMDLDGTIQMNSGVTLDVAGAYDSTADVNAGTWNLGLLRSGGANTNGAFTSAGALDLSADGARVLVEENSQILVAGVINNVVTGGTVTEFDTVTDNSILWNFTLTDVGADNDLDLTIVAANTIEEVVSSSFTGAGNVLFDDLAASTDTEINLVQGEMQAAATAEELNDVVEAVSPTVDGGSVAAGLATASQTAGVTNTRLAMLRTGDAQSGMAAGNVSQGLGMWAQGFGLTADQEERDGVSGYDIDTYGFAVGVDTETLAEDFVIGLGLSYANSEIDSENLASTETDVDTYQLTLYGNYDVDDRTYVSGQLGYAWGDNDQSRTPFGLTADADYDSDTFLARLETGRDYKSGGATITPKLLANYVHYSADDYVETGTAGGALLNVDNDSVNLFEVGVGVDAAWMYQQSNGAYLKPALHAGLRHDLIGDEVEATGAFQAAPTVVFETQGADPAATTLNLGAGVTYYTTDNWELSAGYDFEVKSDYDSHSGILRAGYKF